MFANGGSPGLYAPAARNTLRPDAPRMTLGRWTKLQRKKATRVDQLWLMPPPCKHPVMITGWLQFPELNNQPVCVCMCYYRGRGIHYSTTCWQKCCHTSMGAHAPTLGLHSGTPPRAALALGGSECSRRGSAHLGFIQLAPLHALSSINLSSVLNAGLFGGFFFFQKKKKTPQKP